MYINVRLEVGIAHRLELGIKRLAAIVEPVGDAHLETIGNWMPMRMEIETQYRFSSSP